MAQQLTVNVDQASSESDEQVGVEEKQETSAFFFHYISRRADSDQDMSVSDANLIKEQREQAVQALNDGAAIKVASKLADLGEHWLCK